MSETEQVVARWSEYPYVSHDRRAYTVDHRVVIAHYGDVGADIRHEVRSDDDTGVPDDWTELEAYEIRDRGVRHVPPKEELEVPRS